MGEGGGGETGNRKVTVEICNARNLMPKDGQGTASAYVLVDFDGQRRRTTTKFRDLNPQWDEKLEFLVDDPDSMASETLEVTVYNDKKTGKRTTFLGKVKISGGSFVKRSGEEEVALVYYPLEKRSVFSQIKGEIGLRVWYVDECPKSDETEKKEVVAEEKKNNNSEGEKKEGEEKKGDEEKKKDEKKAPSKAEEEKAKPEENSSKNNKKKKDSEDKGNAEEEKQKTPEKPKKETKEKDKVMKEEQPAVTETPPPQPPVLTVSTPSKVVSSFASSRTGELDIRSQLGDRTGNSNDLVEKIQYLFVRVLKAKKSSDSDQSLYAKVSIGTHSVRTRVVQNGSEWDQVFAFHKGSLNSTALDISVWAEKKKNKKKESTTTTTDDATAETETVVADSCLGVVSFDLQEIPKRLPPDSPLAPQWYTLEGENGNNGGGGGEDLMLATWLGTQVDEAFQGAWQSDSGGYNAHTRSKAYLSPKLWYLRVTIIQTQDLRFPAVATSANRELSVKGQLGPQIFKTSKPVTPATSNGGSTAWNEDLVFVAAEPFDPFLLVTVEDSGKPVGHAKVHVSTIHRRVDDRSEPPPRWLNLATNDADRPYAGRIHIRVCLEGGYHVLDEAANITSDVRAASKQLSKPLIGILDVGIRCASNLLPIKPAATNDGSTGGSTDAYVVLKYGPKWARTRSIVDHFNPRWDEQYSWDVFDPCTVLTVGVFDNGRHVGKQDIRIGKVRIRLSTLDTNRVYLNTYPLMLIHPTGAKKMGEIELTIRFTCPSWISLIQSYTSPLLPRMHYVRPLGPAQQDLLRHAAMRIVSSRLARSEPPLGPEVVQFMLDTEANAWSMRKSKANWFRVVGCLSFIVGVAKWINAIRTWQNPTVTILVHMLLAAVVFCPNLLLPTIFMYLFLILMWRYRLRQRVPAVTMDPRLSCVDLVSPDELSEEFDTYPSGRSVEEVKARYDRLRALAGRAQTLLGDMASQGERLEGLMCWRDPRATAIFAVFCLVSAMVFYVVPLPIMSLVVGMYYLRHPRFRDDMPPPPMNFFRRLPSLADRLT